MRRDHPLFYEEGAWDDLVVRLNIRLSDTVERVKADLGLGGPDAAVYVHLCAGGPAKVSDLADALHLHRNDVYRTTERLMQRGLIQSTMERPARFVAVAPERVFDQEIADRLNAIENLRKSRTEVMSLIEQLHGLAPHAPKGIYKILQGRPAIYAHRDQLLEHARGSVDWACSHFPTLRHDDVNGSLDLMARRGREGIHIRLLLGTTPDAVPRLAPLRELAPVSMREFVCDTPVRFLIADDAEILMWVVNDPSDSLYAADDVAIYTTAPGFVAAQQHFMDTAWAAAPPLGSR